MNLAIDISKNNIKVGLKETIRAINMGKVSSVILAKDADEFVSRKIKSIVLEKKIKLYTVEKKQDLGNICKIDVAAAVAAIIK